MSARPLELGAAGKRVVANVRLLRMSRRMTQVELAERLNKVGRPIPVVGIWRLENSERRVDVDDLVALAEVFGVTPAELMGEVDVCSACFGGPPAGFTCNTCGLAGGAL